MTRILNRWWQQWLITADEATTRARSTWRSSYDPMVSNQPLRLSGLEPRILFSATPIDLATVPGGGEAAMVVEAELQTATGATTIETLAEQAASDQSPRELIIIDSAVPDIEQLLDDLRASGRDAEVFVLEADRDGVDQITELLDSRTDVGSMHVVSHAEDGAVKLGNVWLSESNLAGYAGQIASWQSSLSSDADILLYGCDLAGSSSGQTLIESMSALSGADVAASTDDTGHVTYNGDWDLEYTTGEIESQVAFSDQLQQNWLGKLNTITVDTLIDEVTSNGFTSLREAIIQANSGGGGDTIILGPGTYNLTIAGTNENLGLDGDLDILQNVTIEGAGARTTIIDATVLGERAFHLRDTSVLTMSGVTIQGGNQNNGGGIFVDGTSTLNLSHALLTNNTSDWGGAIHVHGTAHLNHVLLYNNSVTRPGPGDAEGGAIHFHGAVDGSLTNVTISGNSSEDSGGGLWTDTAIRITNSTITGNSAADGGGLVNDGLALDISNTIVAGNTATGVNKDVLGDFTSNQFNLIEVVGAATGFDDDLTGVTANLAGLNNNGGQIDTHALLSGSFAINAGNAADSPAGDARGFARRDGLVDIGAYESNAVPINKIYWSDQGNNKISRSDLDGSNEENIVTGLSGTNGIGLFIDTTSGKIYWTEQANGVIRRVNMDGSDIEDVLTGLTEPREIAIDASEGKIYWTEDGFGSNKIRRANLDGTIIEDLITVGLNDPGGIALDVAAGKMYWVDTGDMKIQRADLDGSNVEDLVTGLNGPRRLKLDLSGGKMYWTDDGVGNRISRANLDGSGVEDLITTGLLSPAGLELDLQAGKIYWTDFGTNKIQMSNLDGTDVQDVITISLNTPVGIALGSAIAAGDVNDPPTLTATPNNPTFTEDGAAVTIFSGSDADSVESGQTFTELTLTVTNVSDGADEILGVDGSDLELTDSNAGTTTNNSMSYSVSVTGTTATVTLSGGSLSATQLQTLVDAISYHDHSEDPDTADRIVTLTSLKDSGGNTNGGNDTATLSIASTVTVNGLNDAPTLSGGPFNMSGTNEDTVSTGMQVVNILAGLTNNDAEGDTLGLAVTAASGKGTWQYSIDSTNGSDGNWTGFGSVSNNSALLLSSTTWVRYAPDSLNGENVTITFHAWDGSTGAASSAGAPSTANPAGGGLTTAFSDTTAEADLVVSEVNDATTDITLDNLNVDENVHGAVIGNLSAIDQDAIDSHVWSVDDARFEVVSGQLKLKAGATLNHEAEPTVNVAITVTDQGGAGIDFDKTFTITVDNVNEAPIADAETYSTKTGNTLASAAPGVLAGDMDPEGDNFTAVLLRDVTNGTLTLGADGSFVYTPDDGFVGTDTFEYEAWDGSMSSASTTVTINVEPAIVPLPPTLPPVVSGDPDSDPTDELSDEPAEEDSDADGEESESEPGVGSADGGGAASAPASAPEVVPATSTNEIPAESDSEAATAFASTLINVTDDSNGIRKADDRSSENVERVQRLRTNQLIASAAQANYVVMAAPGVMWNKLDEQMEQVESQIQGDLIVVGTAGAAASSFTVGVVAWALRTGFLASGLLAQLPAWRGIDPLTIMQGLGGSENNETLEEMMKRQSEALDD